jgi:phospholipid/cholesterol/gamma-HCH transport system substrate-binding protein
MTDINAGKGTLGKLARDEALARKVDDSISRLNTILDRLEKGEGTAGKLLVDPALYNHADATLESAHQLIEAIRKNPKTYLTIHLKIF